MVWVVAGVGGEDNLKEKSQESSAPQIHRETKGKGQHTQRVQMNTINIIDNGIMGMAKAS